MQGGLRSETESAEGSCTWSADPPTAEITKKTQGILGNGREERKCQKNRTRNLLRLSFLRSGRKDGQFELNPHGDTTPNKVCKKTPARRQREEASWLKADNPAQALDLR
jgi:hypothetical protein